MSRGSITKNEIRVQVLKIKDNLYKDQISYSADPKALAHKYLNEVLDRIEEFRN